LERETWSLLLHYSHRSDDVLFRDTEFVSELAWGLEMKRLSKITTVVSGVAEVIPPSDLNKQTKDPEQ